MPIRRKYPPTADRITIFIAAWREIAPAASFAGMTLAEFEARTRPVRDNAQRIGALDAQLAAAQTERLKVDAEAKEALALVVNSVRGDPQYGEDSQLYRALGYIPKSERRSGLTRRGPAPGPAGEAA